MKNYRVDSYIKTSYFPMLYAVTSILQGCNISNVLSWDINVKSNNLKVKVEWMVSESPNISSELYPKAVLNTISLYNLEQPTWSTSFAKNRLILHAEWKVIAPLNSNISSSDPSSFSTPLHDRNSFSTSVYNQNSSFAPQDSAGDSGYHSFNSSHNNNNSRLSNSPVWPAKRLVFQSHKVSSKRNDVFHQPISDNKPALKQGRVIRVDVSNKAKYTDNSQPNNTSDVNFNLSVNAVPFESTLTDQIVISTSEIKEQNTQPTTSAKVHTDLHENSEDIDNSQQVNIPCEVNKQSSPVDELESHATGKSTNNSNNSKPQDNIEDSEYYSDLDYEPLSDFYPNENSFGRPPKKLILSNGFLKDDIDVEFMKLNGRCRLCNSDVPSYLSQLYSIECPKLNLTPVENFDKSFSKRMMTSTNSVINIAKDHLAYKYQDDQVPNQYFLTTEKFNKFGKALDKLVANQTYSFFESCGLAQSRTVDILSYEHLI
jgi:hypothetical protein